jgi:hypothetical protein
MKHDPIIYSAADIIRSARDAATRQGLAPENNFDAIEAYWRDPKPFEAEQRAGQARIDALFAGHEEKCRLEREARWAAEEQN